MRANRLTLNFCSPYIIKQKRCYISLELYLRYYEATCIHSACFSFTLSLCYRLICCISIRFTHFFPVAPRLLCIYFLLPGTRVYYSLRPASARSLLVNHFDSRDSSGGDLIHWRYNEQPQRSVESWVQYLLFFFTYNKYKVQRHSTVLSGIKSNIFQLVKTKMKSEIWFWNLWGSDENTQEKRWQIKTAKGYEQFHVCMHHSVTGLCQLQGACICMYVWCGQWRNVTRYCA